MQWSTQLRLVYKLHRSRPSAWCIVRVQNRTVINNSKLRVTSPLQDIWRMISSKIASWSPSTLRGWTNHSTPSISPVLTIGSLLSHQWNRSLRRTIAQSLCQLSFLALFSPRTRGVWTHLSSVWQEGWKTRQKWSPRHNSISTRKLKISNSCRSEIKAAVTYCPLSKVTRQLTLRNNSRITICASMPWKHTICSIRFSIISSQVITHIYRNKLLTKKRQPSLGTVARLSLKSTRNSII